ncbi:MAG: TlpA family protein disulfide reductase [Actinomycetota bacterium]|nr:TlpA family protein disulfide reductase [Actinomycetota bacterium]
MARGRGALTSSELRWTIVVVLLAAVGVVALWPLLKGGPSVPPSGSVNPQFGIGADVGSPVPDDVELAPLRREAALSPCPSPALDAPAPTGPLAGVVVPCLGSPGAVDLGPALAGRPVLLNVWASWCAPCREEIPVLSDYADDSGAIAVIGVNVQDRPSDALQLLVDLGARYPSVADPEGDLRAALQAPPILPTSYVVRPDGSLQRVDPPAVFRTPEEIRLTVGRYLASSG